MLRALSMFSLGAVFLLISPKLRNQVHDGVAAVVSRIEFFAPYSYIAGVILIFITMVISFNRGSKAR
jgi:hypothetical protein